MYALLKESILSILNNLLAYCNHRNSTITEFVGISSGKDPVSFSFSFFLPLHLFVCVSPLY